MLRSCLLASAPSASTHVAARLDAAFTQQRGHRHAGPLAAAREPVDALHVGFGRAAAPFAAAVAGALEEVDARDRRQALQLVDAEHERAIDEAVNRQRVRRRIDLGHARVMPLEMQRRGRDDAVGVVQRRAARGFFERHLGVLVEVARRFLEPRSRSVRADGGAQRARLGGGGRGFRSARDEGGAPRRAETQEPAAGATVHAAYCGILHI